MNSQPFHFVTKKWWNININWLIRTVGGKCLYSVFITVARRQVLHPQPTSSCLHFFLSLKNVQNKSNILTTWLTNVIFLFSITFISFHSPFTYFKLQHAFLSLSNASLSPFSITIVPLLLDRTFSFSPRFSSHSRKQDAPGKSLCTNLSNF